MRNVNLMPEPRPLNDKDRELIGGVGIVYKCPPGMENCTDAEVQFDGEKLWMPYTLNEIELAALATGATLYLLVWGRALPPVALHVE
jgi:hypothetical protein